MLSKSRLKQLLYGSELRTTAIIANGLVHRTPKHVILNQIKSDLLVSNKFIHLNSVEISHLYTSFVNRYIKVSKRVFSSLRRSDENYKDKLAERQNVVYSEIRKSVLKQMERDKNELADIVDRRNKQENLRELTSEGVFFLCSAHEKPAKDHKDYEGKVYVVEDWEARVQDEQDKARIAAYIRNRNIQTVEWVTGAPVYMIYRPNCKHYFIPVTVEEVLGSSAKTLVKRHKAIIPNENPISYEKSQYKAYYERNKALLYLREMCPSEELDKDIAASRKLMKKWAARAIRAGK